MKFILNTKKEKTLTLKSVGYGVPFIFKNGSFNIDKLNEKAISIKLQTENSMSIIHPEDESLVAELIYGNCTLELNTSEIVLLDIKSEVSIK